MTNILSQSEVAAIRERAAKATPGPWRWRYCHGGRPMLAHPGHGMLVVLDAVRDGMNGAQLRFAKRNPNDMGGLLYKASDLLERPGLGVPDFQDADNPDMAFIAASRTDAVALCDTVDALRAKLEVAKEIVTEAYEFVAGDGASVDLKRAQVFLASLKEPQ